MSEEPQSPEQFIKSKPQQQDAPAPKMDKPLKGIDLGAKPPPHKFAPGEEEKLRKMAEEEQGKERVNTEWYLASPGEKHTSGHSTWQAQDIRYRGKGK